jgi:hypothetical protein
MTKEAGATLTIPPRWKPTQFTVHFEGDDLAGDQVPFAGTMVAQLRTDVRPGSVAAAIKDADISSVRRSLPGMRVVDSGNVDLEGAKVEFVEWTYPDVALGGVRQAVFYLDLDGDLYTLTATHRIDRFDAVRPDVIAVVRSLLQGWRTR